MSKKAAIVLDTWKIETFKKILKEAGYEFEEFPGVTPDTITLKVEYDLVASLTPVIEKAQRECRNFKNKS